MNAQRMTTHLFHQPGICLGLSEKFINQTFIKVMSA